MNELRSNPPPVVTALSGTVLPSETRSKALIPSVTSGRGSGGQSGWVPGLEIGFQAEFYNPLFRGIRSSPNSSALLSLVPST